MFTTKYLKNSLSSYKMFSKNIFGKMQMAPVDPILGTVAAFKADSSPTKMNLGVGAYRTEEGNPLIFNVVKKVEQQLTEETVNDKANKEYLPIDGLAEFNQLSKELIFGTNKEYNEGVVTVQALSGTGALRVGFEFIADHMPNKLHFPDKTWGNHMAIATNAGLEHSKYPYYEPKTRGFDFEGMTGYLKNLNEGEIVLMHPIAHNPTGVDPSFDQWKVIAEIMQERKLIPFFDTAYQGYATGDVEADAKVMRYFAELKFQMFISQSYAKNMGLYGERIGALHLVTNCKDSAKVALSQIKLNIRAMYSNPPVHGARIVAKVLGNDANLAAWKQELKEVSERISGVRHALRDELIKLNTPGNWDHITNQIGMFSFTGLTEKQVENMISKHSVYMLKNGRISLSGINKSNVKYLANAIHDSVTNF